MSKYIEIECTACHIIFPRLLKQYKSQVKKSGTNYKPLCSNNCKKLLKKKKVLVNCKNCGSEFEKFHCQIIKSNNNNFCNTSCAAQFNNKARAKLPLTKEVNCKYCNLIFICKRTSPKIVCNSCKKINKNHFYKKHSYKNAIKISYCITCKVELKSKTGKKKYCNPCRKIFYSDLFRRVSQLSVLKQVRRSKNEIYFAELCMKEFSNVTTNELFFKSKYGLWDADVILHDHKIAVLWNGIWHYQQVRVKHSLLQVQTRDKIKNDVILANGYQCYIIKDMGKHNKGFVENEFEKFKLIMN